MIQVTLRCGSQAYLTCRGANVLIGLRYSFPIVWHRSGSYRWDGAEHALDIVSAFPEWWRLTPSGPTYNKILMDQFIDRGMSPMAAQHACEEVRRHYRERHGRFVFGDIIFYELDDGHWAADTYDENGNFMIGDGAAHWAGEPLPQRTGRFIRFNGVVN